MTANGTFNNALLETLIKEIVEKRDFTLFRIQCRAERIGDDNYSGKINKTKVSAQMKKCQI